MKSSPSFWHVALLCALLDLQASSLEAQSYARLIDHHQTLQSSNRGSEARLEDGGAVLCGQTGGCCDLGVLRLDSSDNVVWYKVLAGVSDWARPRICGQFPNGDIFLICTPQQNFGLSRFEIIRMSIDGGVIWSKDYEVSETFMVSSAWARCLPDGDLILQLGLADQSTTVTRIDGSGAVVWSNRYAESAIDPTFYPKHHGHADGQAILSVHSNIWEDGGYITEFRVLRLDPNGTVQWSRTYQCPYAPQVLDVVRSTDGSWILAGLLDNNGSRSMFMAQMDDLGNVQWAKEYPDLYWYGDKELHVHRLSNDELLFSNNRNGFEFVHTTASGVPIEIFHFQQQLMGMTRGSILEASPQRVRLAGQMGYTPPDWSYLNYHFDLAFSLNAPEQCQWTVEDLGYTDMSILFSGEEAITSSPVLLPITDQSFVVTDFPAELIGEACEFATGIASQEPLDLELRIHPTPNDGLWWVDIPDRFQSSREIILSVRDVAGRLALRMRVPSSAQARVDLRGLTDGLYEVELFDGTTRYHGRTVIE